ncbi:MAG: hypothetical protein H6766_03895 [Candidatus Peribacteria bacterium]|nr:MAG: hypothetical protein H6766_03895 [Candidatus Peribacteria bacterium]
MTKTEQLHQNLTILINDLDIAPFIAEEAHHFVSQLNYYKLQKISDQSDVFARYLCALDRENTMMIKNTVPMKTS